MFLFAEGGHHTPLIVEFINHYLGKPVHEFQMAYTKPIWDKFGKRDSLVHDHVRDRVHSVGDRHRDL